MTEDTNSTLTRPASTASGAGNQLRQSKQYTNRPQLRKVLIAAIGIGVLGLGGYFWQRSVSIVETDDAYIVGHVHQLSSRVAGPIVKILVEDNQHINKGDLLMEVDPRDYQLAADSARLAADKARLESSEAESSALSSTKVASADHYQATSAATSSKAGVTKAKAQLQEADSGVVLASAQLRQRRAELEKADADLVRYADLIKDRAITAQSFDQVKEAQSVARASLDAAKANVTQAETRVLQAKQSLLDAQSTVILSVGSKETALAAEAQAETSRRDIGVKTAAAKEAQVEYDNALTQLSYTNITAPVSGRAGHRTVELGQQVERGEALMSIVSDERWVVANFKETQLQKMRIGQPVEIKVDSFSDKVFHGKVQSISPASGAQFTLLPPDNASGNFTKVVQRFPVKILFDPSSIKGYEDRLSPGMSVVAEVHISGN